MHPDGWITGQIVPDKLTGDIWVAGPRGTARGQEGTCLRLAAAALPPAWPNTPEGAPAAQLVPQWHVTNGDMLLLPCFVRSVALIESNAAGFPQIHMSAQRRREKERDFICSFSERSDK